MAGYDSQAQQRYMNLQKRRGLVSAQLVDQMNLETKPMGGYDRLRQSENQGNAMSALRGKKQKRSKS